MLLKDWNDKLEDNLFLLKICRASCPVAEVSGVETYTPHSLLYIAYLLFRDLIDWEPENVEPFFMCQLCRRCNSYCEGFPFAEIIESARREAFLRKAIPQRVKKAEKKIEETLANWRKKLIYEIEPTKYRNSDTILLAGEGYWGYPLFINKAIKISEKIIGEITYKPVQEPYTGSHLWIIGDMEKLKEKAIELKNSLKSYERAIVLDPLAYYTITKVYPNIGVELDIEIKYLIEILQKSKKDIVIKAHGEKIAYTYPIELNLIDYQKEILSFLKSLGVTPIEPQYKDRTAYPTGGMGFFNFIDKKIADEITKEKIEMLIQSTKTKTFLTPSPWEYRDLTMLSKDYDIVVMEILEALDVQK